MGFLGFYYVSALILALWPQAYTINWEFALEVSIYSFFAPTPSWLWKSLYYSFMPPTKMCCYSFRSPVGRCSALNPPPPHRVCNHDAVVFWNMFSELSLNLTLEWLSGSNLLGLIKCKHGEQMPTGEGFSILLSHLCLQTRCAVAVKQTNKQVCLCNKWFTDVGAVARQLCEDVKLFVTL